MKKLPFGIGVIATLVIIEAIMQVLAAFALFGISSLGFFVATFGPSFALFAIGIMFLIIGLVELTVGVGLFSMEKWAWIVTVIVVWIDLVVDVLAGLIQVQSVGSIFWSMVIPVIVLMYMYKKNVRKQFSR